MQEWEHLAPDKVVGSKMLPLRQFYKNEARQSVFVGAQCLRPTKGLHIAPLQEIFIDL
ncbi:hypothetical protein Oscil6304_3647 [Oscillatoria acuminata PCC 6304]|uniref:Uncharacterized protein n=1 Tax=Oscillatoria acuminata PCC 6304 TaxID=56110 RepID=K9TKZ3_9CYAN|nr:hypothetical protein Oscil6304_3647 [Oscillatoria acuminata PCC 6304]